MSLPPDPDDERLQAVVGPEPDPEAATAGGDGDGDEAPPPGSDDPVDGDAPTG